METGSSSHPAGLQVCCTKTVRVLFCLVSLNHESAAHGEINVFFKNIFGFRGTPGEESGGHPPVGGEAFATKTSN